MAMNTRDRRALTVGGIILAAAVLYRIALAPTVADWRDARADLAQNQEQLAQVDSRLDRSESMRDRLRPKLGPGVDRPTLSVDELRVAFPAAVQSAINTAGAQTQQIDIQGVRRLRGVSGVSTLSLRVRAVCPEAAIPQLLRELNNAPYPAVIESCSLSMAQPNQRQQWQLLLTVSTPALDPGGRR